MLATLAKAGSSELTLRLTKPDYFQQLFDLALMPRSPVLVSALNVCIYLLETRRHRIPSIPGEEDEEAAREKLKLTDDVEKLAVEGVALHVPQLTALLDQ